MFGICKQLHKYVVLTFLDCIRCPENNANPGSFSAFEHCEHFIVLCGAKKTNATL